MLASLSFQNTVTNASTGNRPHPDVRPAKKAAAALRAHPAGQSRNMLHWPTILGVALLHASAVLLFSMQPVRATILRASTMMVALIPSPAAAAPSKPMPVRRQSRIDARAAPALAVESTRPPATAVSAAQDMAPADTSPAPPLTQPAPTPEPPQFDVAYLRNPAPIYPAFSKRLREQGTVLLRVRVSAGGSSELVEIHASSGAKRLDDAAIEAVRHWRFIPARLGAAAVPGWALVPIAFHLA